MVLFVPFLSCLVWEEVFYSVAISKRIMSNRVSGKAFIATTYILTIGVVGISVHAGGGAISGTAIFPILICAVLPILFVALVSTTNVCFCIERCLHLTANVRKSSAIVVADKDQFWTRAQYASELLDQGYGAHLVVFVPHSEPFREFLTTTLSVPEDSIVWARPGHYNNTRLSALAVADLCKERGWESVLVVADSYKIRRAALSIARATRKCV